MNQESYDLESWKCRLKVDLPNLTQSQILQKTETKRLFSIIGSKLQLAYKEGEPVKVLYNLVACPSLMSNFAAFRTDKDVESKVKARREYT